MVAMHRSSMHSRCQIYRTECEKSHFVVTEGDRVIRVAVNITMLMVDRSITLVSRVSHRYTSSESEMNSNHGRVRVIKYNSDEEISVRSLTCDAGWVVRRLPST